MAQFVRLDEDVVNLDLVTDSRWDPKTRTLIVRFAVLNTDCIHTRSFAGDDARRLRRWFERNAIDILVDAREAAIAIDHAEAKSGERTLRGKQTSVLESPTSFYTDGP